MSGHHRASRDRDASFWKPVNLSMIQSDHARGPADATSHFGIQVKSISAVNDMRRRLESAGLATKVEESVNCCHAVQDKIWILDPNGHRWEVFVVLDDAPTGKADTRCGVARRIGVHSQDFPTTNGCHLRGSVRIHDPSDTVSDRDASHLNRHLFE